MKVLRFCGFGLELVIDEVLTRRSDDPIVCAASDPTGQRWLIVEADHASDKMSWVCAPASDRMLEMVSSGRAQAGDAVHHSQTGWVEMVSIINGRSVPDRRVLCSTLPAEVGIPHLLSA